LKIINDENAAEMSPSSSSSSRPSSTKCKWCSAPLYFVQLDNGKWLPYSFSTKQYHNCPLKPESAIKKYFCQYCNVEIRWNEAVKSRNNKCLPLNVDGSRHWCKENPIAKQLELKKQQKRVEQGLPKSRPFAQNPPGTPKQLTPEVKRLKKEFQHFKDDTRKEIIDKLQRN